MVIQVICLGSARIAGEGMRIGIVRHSAWGVSNIRYALERWYDLWFPNPVPSLERVNHAHEEKIKDGWRTFVYGQ